VPGTPLYARLLKQGRQLEPGRGERCTLFDVNYRPKNMSPQELRDGLYWLSERLYSREGVEQRRRGFFENLRRRRPASLHEAELAPRRPHSAATHQERHLPASGRVAAAPRSF
jgi:hypothetical protein